MKIPGWSAEGWQVGGIKSLKDILNQNNPQCEADFMPRHRETVLSVLVFLHLHSPVMWEDQGFQALLPLIVPWIFAWENYKSTGTIRVLKLHVLFQTKDTIGLPCKRHIALKQPVYTCVSFPVLDSMAGIKRGESVCWTRSPLVHISLSSAFIWPRSGLMRLSERVPRAAIAHSSQAFTPFWALPLGIIAV